MGFSGLLSCTNSVCFRILKLIIHTYYVMHTARKSPSLIFYNVDKTQERCIFIKSVNPSAAQDANLHNRMFSYLLCYRCSFTRLRFIRLIIPSMSLHTYLHTELSFPHYIHRITLKFVHDYYTCIVTSAQKVNKIVEYICSVNTE